MNERVRPSGTRDSRQFDRRNLTALQNITDDGLDALSPGLFWRVLTHLLTKLEVAKKSGYVHIWYSHATSSEIFSGRAERFENSPLRPELKEWIQKHPTWVKNHEDTGGPDYSVMGDRFSWGVKHEVRVDEKRALRELDEFHTFNQRVLRRYAEVWGYPAMLTRRKLDVAQTVAEARAFPGEVALGGRVFRLCAPEPIDSDRPEYCEVLAPDESDSFDVAFADSQANVAKLLEDGARYTKARSRYSDEELVAMAKKPGGICKALGIT